MALNGKTVNHIPGLLLLITLLVVVWSLPAAAEEIYKAAPVNKPEDLRLLPAEAWPPPEAEGPEMLMKLTYLRGLLDALQYVQVSPRGAGKVLSGLEGKTVHQLAAALDQYYLADPRRRELPPAVVLMRLLPEARPQPPSASPPASAPPAAPAPAPAAPGN